MKKTRLSILTFALISVIGNVAAQDTIFLHNGKQLISKIIEVNGNHIKYKDISNENGPDYIIETKSVASLHLQNGVIQNPADLFTDSLAEIPDLMYINDVPIAKNVSKETQYKSEIERQNRPIRENFQPNADYDLTNRRVMPSQNYRINKKIYNPRYYIPHYSDPYNPALTGLASFFIPGLGQMISNEVGRGLGFLGGYVGSTFVMIAGLSMQVYDTDNVSNYPYTTIYNQYVTDEGMAVFLVGLAGAITSHIWSIFDAVRVAKVNNMYMQDLRNNYVSFELKPYVSKSNTYLPQKHQAMGLSLSVNF